MDATTQTDAIEVSSKSSQSTTTVSQEVEVKTSNEITNETGSDLGNIRAGSSLVRFLRSAEEILKQEINSSVLVSKELSSILHGLLLNQAAEFSVVQLHALYSDHLINQLGQEESDKKQFNLVVSAIEWNCSSSVLAVGYHVDKHSHFCDHESFLCIWSLFRSYTRESHPSSTIETDGCVTVISSHPTVSSIFAVATASGHVLVIDSQSSNSSSSSASASHEEGVSFLTWVTELSFLISLSYDGRILVWKYDVTKRSLIALKQYSILTGDLPKAICKDPLGKSRVGISAAAVVSRGASSCRLAIGCWGGGLLLCSLEWKDQEASSGKSVLEVTESPVVLSYAPHRNNITSVNVWRENPVFFLSSSSDGELRVHHVNQSKPIAVYHCESSIEYASWSLCHSLIYCLLEDSATVTAISFSANEEEENRLFGRQSGLIIRPNQSENVIRFWLNVHKGRQEEMALAWSSGDIKVVHLQLQ